MLIRISEGASEFEKCVLTVIAVKVLRHNFTGSFATTVSMTKRAIEQAFTYSGSDMVSRSLYPHGPSLGISRSGD